MRTRPFPVEKLLALIADWLPPTDTDTTTASITFRMQRSNGDARVYDVEASVNGDTKFFLRNEQ